MARMQKVVAIVGPTAVGKTALSIELAKAVAGEIVSADSRQVYKGLDIGTGKVTHAEMQGVPHHLLDIASPKYVFTAADFVREGRTAIAEVAARSRTPVIVGGTGFYIDALLGKVQLADVGIDADFRAHAVRLSLEELQKELQRLDPARYEKIDINNPQRLIRAIEIAKALGAVPYMEPEKLYEILWIGITLPKKELDENIHTRLVARMKAGMLAEAQRLRAEGLSYERMESLGLEYRYMARFLEGNISEEEMLAELESEIKKYAKRQMTWFKKNKDIKWFLPSQNAEMLSLAKQFLAN